MGLLMRAFVVVYYVVIIFIVPIYLGNQALIAFKATGNLWKLVLALFFIGGWAVTLSELFKGMIVMFLSSKPSVKEEGEVKTAPKYTDEEHESRR